MSRDDLFKKWTLISQDALSEIAKRILSPGIHQLGTTALPVEIQKMPGAASYFITTYSTPISLGSSNTLARGELAVVRNDQGLWKAYNYVFASSGDGQVYFNGPYKNFSDHHFSSSSQISLENLFGHIPGSTSGSV